jgi:DNA-binding GntR family transcriptional regulator
VIKKRSSSYEIVTESGQIPTRRSLRLEAADKLRDLILLEQLPPGTAVPERDLAEALGISRTPLKDALRILEVEGLIKYGSTGRPHVANPSLKEVEQNCIVLSALEGLAGNLACKSATDEEIEEILALEKSMRVLPEDAYGTLEFYHLDMGFHTKIVEVVKNGPLWTTHQQYMIWLWRARSIPSMRKERRENTLNEHNKIAAALAKRDSRATSSALRGHLNSTRRNIRRLWRKDAKA